MELRIEGLSRDFDGFAALTDVDLAVQSGELAALLGPSGSGKTTLLRLIAGLIAPSAGRIFFGAEDASRLSVQERHVGFVFQHYALFRNMSVLENIAFGLRVQPRSRRLPESKIKGRAEELLDLVQLPGLGARFPAQLSGGQRQRVALARALAIQPRLLLLDEPFGALDAKVRRELRRWLREIHDKTGHTTLFVTHDQDEALELADRVVVMNQGRIVQSGSPDAIYDAPNSPFVFGFIGESNCLPIAIEDGAVRFDGRPTGLKADGIGPANLFFRPQDAVLGDASPRSNGLAPFSGRVGAIRRHQGVLRVEVELGQAARVEIEAPVQFALGRGADIAFTLRRWQAFPTGSN